MQNASGAKRTHCTSVYFSMILAFIILVRLWVLRRNFYRKTTVLKMSGANSAATTDFKAKNIT